MPTVNIQPPNEIYGTFARLNYKPWYTIAEFVDNATQNYFDHRRALKSAGSEALTIDMNYDGAERTLWVTDNAHGMDLADLERAMRISTPPPSRDGRSEFGMGMKTAACWFGPRWTVNTTKLGVDKRYRVTFDIEELSNSGAASIEVIEESAHPDEHGTVITIYELRKPIVGRQVQKIRKLLTSMYRADLRSGDVKLWWRDEELEYADPLLWRNEREDGTTAPLRQEIHLSVTDPATGDEHVVNGWVGVLQTMSNVDSGFALLRRGRVILGGPDEGWKPTTVVGSVGTHSWKRLTGELYLDDFPVNFTKDGFAWDGGLEDELVDKLNPLVSTYRRFASNLRVKPQGGGAAPRDFARSVEEVQEGVSEPSFKSDIAIVTTPPPPGLELPPESFEASPAEMVPARLEVPLGTTPVAATLYVKDEGTSAPWLTLKPMSSQDLDILLNTAHPFVAMCLDDEEARDAIGKVALSVAIAEQQARLLHGDSAPTEEVRKLMDKILLHAVRP